MSCKAKQWSVPSLRPGEVIPVGQRWGSVRFWTIWTLCELVASVPWASEKERYKKLGFESWTLQNQTAWGGSKEPWPDTSSLTLVLHLRGNQERRRVGRRQKEGEGKTEFPLARATKLSERGGAFGATSAGKERAAWFHSGSVHSLKLRGSEAGSGGASLVWLLLKLGLCLWIHSRNAPNLIFLFWKMRARFGICDV